MLRLPLAVFAILATANVALAQPAQVIIIRHAEKPEDGNELNLRGRERAGALVAYFESAPEVTEFKTPTAIYAQLPKDETSSIRSAQTVQPLADALHLALHRTFTKTQHLQMVDEIMHKPEYAGHTVLICWEHKVIPDMAREFGVTDGPTKWSGSVYDRAWVITFHADAKPTLKVVPERLMYGDSSE
jgi:hypothetical protein